MNKQYYTLLYNEAFRILGHTTPLKGDCGMVCDKACCKGDNKTGMLLFPNEETTLNVTEKNNRRLAVCNGSCNRNERPLACRLFPFFPVVNPDGKITAELDIRGAAVCPLVTHSDDVVFSKRFLHRVEKVGELLMSDSQCANFLSDISNEIEAEKMLFSLIAKDE